MKIVCTPGKDGVTVVKTHAVDATTGKLSAVTNTTTETPAAVDEV